MNTLTAFLRYLEEQHANGSIYVWGAQGQTKPVITEAWIKKRETSDANADRAIALWKKQTANGYGEVLRAFDCSGLGMYWLQTLKGVYQSDLSANGMLGKCARITRAELKRGDWVFRVYTSGANKGKVYHIGYVADDALHTIEAKGRDDGVVKRALNASGASYWNAYGRPAVFRAEIEAGTPGKETMLSAQAGGADNRGDAPGADGGSIFFATCTGKRVRVRKGGSTKNDILCTACAGDKLLAQAADGAFLRVAVASGGEIVVGYMSRKYIGGIE